MNELATKEFAADVLRHLRELTKAQIFVSNTQKPFGVQKIRYDLATAKLETSPQELKLPFRSFYVETASSPNAKLFIKLGDRDDGQSAVGVVVKDSWKTDQPVAQAFLHWPAQPGEWIEIVYFVDSEFISGTQLSVTAGGISVSDGSSASAPIAVTLVAATAAVIAPGLLTRKVATLQNKTGASLYVAGSPTVTNAGATEGLEIPNGGFFKWRNSAALYGYSVAGGKVTRIEEA